MFNLQRPVTVVCPYCGNRFKESIRRRQKNAVVRHKACDVVLECDINELDEFLREKAKDALAEFRLRLEDSKRDG